MGLLSRTVPVRCSLLWVPHYRRLVFLAFLCLRPATLLRRSEVPRTMPQCTVVVYIRKRLAQFFSVAGVFIVGLGRCLLLPQQPQDPS